MEGSGEGRERGIQREKRNQKFKKKKRRAGERWVDETNRNGGENEA